jgi:transcriptional regulator with XRE-family HTH domain
MVGTTPKSRAIGAELRRAREAAGLSARQLALKLGIAHTTVGRWEAGQRAPRPTDVATVLAAVGAPNEVRHELIDLARDTEGRHWVASSFPEQRRQLAAVLELERDAVKIVNVSSSLMPGLLQTADYARAMMSAGQIASGEAETRVAIRIGRRDVIMRHRQPAELLAIVDESVLRRPIGGTATMVEQLRRLDEASRWTNVELRVMTLSAGWHPALEGPFMLIEGADRLPVVVLENRLSALFFHEFDDVEIYRRAVDTMLSMAMSVVDSRTLIAAIIDELETSS